MTMLVNLQKNTGETPNAYHGARATARTTRTVHTQEPPHQSMTLCYHQHNGEDQEANEPKARFDVTTHRE